SRPVHGTNCSFRFGAHSMFYLNCSRMPTMRSHGGVRSISSGDNEPQDVDDNAAADRLDVKHRSRADAAAVRPVRVDIMARHAWKHGFGKENDRRFSHTNGGWIARASGARFPRECYGANGARVRYYLPKEHCLEQEMLQIATNLW
ncbi:MAG: hypothetical protein OXD42_01305, partial [Rhodospirillaceae bacterium]|nr:hypothetical protein [Rhodospirillaceae bacterium]